MDVDLGSFWFHHSLGSLVLTKGIATAAPQKRAETAGDFMTDKITISKKRFNECMYEVVGSGKVREVTSEMHLESEIKTFYSKYVPTA